MAQDVVSDGLNQIMNAKRVGKIKVEIKLYSKVLLKILDTMKEKGVLNYELDEESKMLVVQIIKLNECKAIKPRYYTSHANIEKYLRRFLPSRKLGFLLISTNKGILTHQEVIANEIGGSVIAYFY
jgi:ribosomal protein S8